MCIRDSVYAVAAPEAHEVPMRRVERDRTDHLRRAENVLEVCLLYTSDAADERSSVDLGGRRIIKKKKRTKHRWLT